MIKRMLLSAVLVAITKPAAAQNKQYLSTDGNWFRFEVNQHGAVLTSIERVGGAGFASRTGPRIDVGDIVYLGKSCDAFSEEFGDGSWASTSAGFIVDFAVGRIAFPGQTIELANGRKCR